MFSSSANFTKLKTNLRLAINRLKLIEKKKTELAQKSRKEIADYLANNKIERAKIRVECIIREDYLVEAMEIVEMFCDLLIARFGLLTQMKTLDEGLAESVSSILWIAPRLQTDIPELKVISDLLTQKYGKPYAEACRSENIGTISDKLQHKMSVQSPPKLLVEKYLIEIAKNYDIPYEPDSEVMKADRGIDALLDLNDSNNLSGGSGGMPQPFGFIGFPQPPPLPMNPTSSGNYTPFNYPPMQEKTPFGGGFVTPSQPPQSATSTPTAPNVPYGAPLSYNIPPGAETKDLNTNFMLDDDVPPAYDAVTPTSPEENHHNINKNVGYGKPKPQPRSKLPEKGYPDLPELPNVPSDDTFLEPKKEDEIDFDDLARRFEELKKKK